ncbi:hypothetical protein CNMCM8686_001077 [Aspergillus fumigatus]|nr:hypothetical protein CNMCM8686_001077 [Aspergillus fumigatus]
MQEFWQGYLKGAVPSHLGSQITPENTVAAEVHCDLKRTASQRRVTPGVLLYAAWAIILGLANSTKDVVIGMTFSGRDAPLAGVNKVTPLDKYLEDVQSNLWAVARNALYGLRKILKASSQAKDLFNTMVNFLIKIPTSTPAGGLRQLPESNLRTVEYTRIKLCNESLNRITLTSTLEPRYAQALADTLAAILGAASDQPLTKLREFRLVQPVPRLIERLDDPVGSVPVSAVHTIQAEDRVESPGGELAHSALQRMAASHLSRTAVEDISGARIMYAGLAIKMNQLAGLLRERGLELEQIVPIMLKKSINTIITMFGILVAGGAFLPLGPENPWERNLGILEDCGAKLVITDQLNTDFFKGTFYKVIIINAIAWDTIPL